MRPEKKAEKKIELTENEKLIFDLLSKEKSMNLMVLKVQAALSNKQWDVAIKSLSKNGLTRVTKTGDDLMIDLVN